MSLVVWTGATNSTFSTAGNFRGGSATVDDDELVIQGTVSITGATTGRTLDSLTVGRDYSGDVGSSGSRLIFVDIEQVRLQSNVGRVYLEGSTTLANIYINIPGGRSDAVTLDGVTPLIYIVNTNCGVELVAGIDIGDIFIWNSPGLRLTIGAGSTVDNVYADSGYVLNNSAITTGSPSRVTLTGTARWENALGVDTDMELVEIYGPRAFMDDRGAGDITSSLKATNGGAYSLRRGNGAAKTIAAAVRGPRGVIDLGGVGQSVTLTTGIVDVSAENFDLGRTTNYTGN